MYGVKRGMGVVVRPDGTYYVPSECSWPILGGYLGLVSKACAPPTEAEFLADQRASLGPAALANPALVAQTEAAWKEAIDLQCRNNPADCADYKTAIEYPNLSAAVGSDAIQAGQSVGSFVGGAFERIGDALSSAISLDWGKLLLLGGIAVFGIMTLTAPGPRRYGR